MNYRIEASHLTLDYTPETCALTVRVAGSDITWSWHTVPFLVRADQTSLALTDSDCESHTFDRGTVRGVRATYKNLRDSEGNPTPISVQTEVSLNQATGQLTAMACVLGDGKGELAALAYPPRMRFDAPEGHGYTVLPRMQGAILPAGHDIKINDGIVFERGA